MNSLWLDTNKNNFYSKDLNQNQSTDVCIIGGGILGLTCAYYLTKLGYNVVVLEKDEIARKTTGHTTAKITSQHGLFYDYLINSYSSKFAKDYLEVNEQAIENISNIIEENSISCDFERQNNYVYATNELDLSSVKKEVSAVSSLGFNCEFVTKTGLPFDILGAICFKNQAQFHPLKYISGLCKSISDNGGTIYHYSTVYDVKKEDSKYITYVYNSQDNLNYQIESPFVIMASHYPFIDFPGFYFSKMYQSNSYVIAVDTKKTLFNGMYINASQLVFSYRTANINGRKLLLVGGQDHKTGQADSSQNYYSILENEVKKYYPHAEILYRWSANDCISLDKLPYIGSYSTFLPNLYVGTGFKKWGMTLSNVAANIIVDNICNKDNKYAYLFDSSRLQPIKNHTEVKNMVQDSVSSLLINKIKKSHLDIAQIPNNSGGIIEINNQKIGVYKDVLGNIYAIKPICRHLGCLLSWNNTDKTWDCPCHGSRYDFKGRSIINPAFKDLETYYLD